MRSGYETPSWLFKLTLTILLLLFPTAVWFLTTTTTTTTTTTFTTPTTTIARPVTNYSTSNIQSSSITHNVNAENPVSFGISPVEAPRSPPAPEAKREEGKTVRPSVGPVEESLSRARAAIRRAAAGNWTGSSSSLPLPRVYRNPAAFYRSYREMERRLKVYVYEEGEVPLAHDGPCKSIYAIEGRFIMEMEMMRGGFRTGNPGEANLFFLPFSVAWTVKYVYEAGSLGFDALKQSVGDYVDVVAAKHPYWNRTAGADHFMLSCHDWGPEVSSAKPELFRNSIRAFCNANTSEGFLPRKDVSIPEINLLAGEIPRQVLSPPPPTAPRPILAFFAGGLHGPVRPLLLNYWENRDPDLQVHQYLPSGVDYFKDYMLKSKFCLCPSGYEVASPRVPEAIYAECIPVLISQGYYPPFSDVLRWEEFSVTVGVDEIPRLKEILSGIGEEEVERKREGLRAVRRHFLLNSPAKRFDAFHMILHSVWLRRLNLRTSGYNSS